MAYQPKTLAQISSIGSVITGIGSAYAQSSQYKIQQIQAKQKAEVAKMQGEADSLNLLRDFNKTMASNIVMAAAQGRSGGSVEQIASAAEAQYNWDADFTKLSAEIQAGGYQAQAAQYGIAGTQAMVGGTLGTIQKGLQTYATSLYKIGD